MIYSTLGDENVGQGNFKTATENYERALTIAKEKGDRVLEKKLNIDLGDVFYKLGDFTTAIDYHKSALKIAKEVGDRATEGKSYGNLGTVYHAQGDFKKAVTFHESDLKITEEVKDRDGEGQASNNVGYAYNSLGDYKRALRYLNHSLKIAKELGNRALKGNVYCNLGNTYGNMGYFKAAISYHELELKTAKEVEDRLAELNAYSHLGWDYDRLGDCKKALDYHEHSLKIAKEVGNKAGEEAAYCNIGNAYEGLGDFNTAFEFYNCFLDIAKEMGDRTGEGRAYGDLGNTYFKLGHLLTAIEYHERCLKIFKVAGDIAMEGMSYGNLGNAFYVLGDFKTAIGYQEHSLKIAQKVKDRVGEATSLNGLGKSLESHGSTFKALDCYCSSVKIYNDIRNDLHFEDKWKISFRDMYQNVYTNLWRLLLKQGKVVKALSAADQGRAQALNDLIKLNYVPELPSLAPDETSLRTFRFLPSNTVFIAVDNTEIIFWIIRNDIDQDVQCRITKLEKDVDKLFFQILIQGVYKEIAARAGVKCENRSLEDTRDETLTDEMSQFTVTHFLNFPTDTLKTLYSYIIAPIADLLHGSEVTFSPDGPLCLAPFSALVDSNARYLSQSFRIRVIPSLTSLRMIADYSPDYHIKTGALLVGDPCLEEVVYHGRKLDQLPCAKKEVEMIGNILDTSPLTGKDATKDQVLSRLSSVALVHIAAHGSIETGEIALAPNTTRESKTPVEDDFILTMRDVLSAQMRAKLVVLSCCHSGRGDIMKAEGVVGIGRAFLGAGARSVLVSLWAIDDEATQQFMESFYQQLSRGRSASEALNNAMKCMRDSNEFSQVRYWAPFVLIGDDVTLDFDNGD